jgi:hypothetical protein
METWDRNKIDKNIGTPKPESHPDFGPIFTPYPLFSVLSESKEILLNLSMKC